MKLSAYIPCFNNEATLAQSIASIMRQTTRIDQLMVVDDGSNDRSVQVAESSGATVFQQGRNLGRGAARARAIVEARHELVLSCDATVLLPERFVEGALPYFERHDVAAVFGHFVERKKDSAVRRWRARHLYKQDLPRCVDRKASLITAGVVQKRDCVLAVGNYNPRLRHSEDAELGARLLAAGHEVVSDPKLELECLQDDSLACLFERYWRWYAGPEERISLRGYARTVWYALRVMVRRDLQQHDLGSAVISLLMPHNQFWRSAARGWAKERRGANPGAHPVAGTSQ